MKNKIITMLALLLLMPFTLAQGLEPEVNAGITPDSGLYGLDVLFDNLRIAMTINSFEKAKLRIEIAEERIAEMKLMSESNKLEALDRARIEQEIQMNEIEKIRVKLTDNEKVDIQQRLQKHILVLETVLEKVPEQAKMGIKLALENSVRVFDKQQEDISVELRESKEEIRVKIDAGEVRIVSVTRERR